MAEIKNSQQLEPEIRAQRSADDAAVYIVNRRAFGGDAEARLVEALRQAPDAIPELSLVALVEGQVAGHILFSPVTIKTPNGNVPALSLAPLAVLPERQGQGVGSALVRHGLAEARRLGYLIVLVLGSEGYYPRFGFSRAADFGIYGPFEAALDNYMAIELVEGALAGITGMVSYPPAFELV